MDRMLSRRGFVVASAAFLAAREAAAQAVLDIVVSPAGVAQVGGFEFRCALGRGGVKRDKREGDGATPAGTWPLREVFYRADRILRPVTVMPLRKLKRSDGWCDAPDDAQYNKRVRLPYPASAEHLWRADRLYDLIVVVGYNDAPVVPGAGSAIFLHVARADYGPTAGCVAFSRADLRKILKLTDRRSRLVVQA
jgi:L,D-peptidoglycan transpeptidase YkuD (ErfK/YbiS/YcfS/YnhG family)